MPRSRRRCPASTSTWRSPTPGLLAAAVGLLPERVVVVHQDHRPATGRAPDGLLQHAPAADVVSVPTPAWATWLHESLGEIAPPTVVMADPLPIGFAPRSRLDRPLILAVARLVPDKQLPKLVSAFAEIADRLPGWRLRIVGEGQQRLDLLRQVRKWNLWDRVELVPQRPRPGRRVGQAGDRRRLLPLGGLPAGRAPGDGRRRAGRQLRRRLGPA